VRHSVVLLKPMSVDWDDTNEVVKTLESKSDDVSDGNDGGEP
jgi:hypothetical protein